MSIIERDIAYILNTSDQSLILGTNIYIAKLPHTAHNSVVLTDYGSSITYPVNNLDHHNINCQSRFKNYETGFLFMENIKRIMQSRASEIINNIEYIGFWLKTNIGYIGLERDNSYIHSMDFSVIRKNQDAGFRV